MQSYSHVATACQPMHTGRVFRQLGAALVWLVLVAGSAQAQLICGISGKSITLSQGCAGGGRVQMSMTNIQNDTTLAINTVGGLARYTLRYDFQSCKLADGTQVDGSVSGNVQEYAGIMESGSCRNLPRRSSDPLDVGFFGGSLTSSLTVGGKSIQGTSTFSLEANTPVALTQANGRRYRDIGVGTYEAALERIPRAAMKIPEEGLWAVSSEVDGNPGRGFQLEVRNNVAVATVYGYDEAGNPVFYLATGTLKNGGFSGSLDTFSGGTTFGGATRSAAAAGSAGTVTFSFTDSTHGTVKFPGESSVAINKLDWSDPVYQNGPTSGLWSVDAETDGQAGRGFQIETQNGVMVVTVYGYDGGGKGTFYLGTGTLSGDTLTVPLNVYRGGKTFGGSSRSATDAGSVGQMKLRFIDDLTGEVTFPGESTKRVSKLVW